MGSSVPPERNERQMSSLVTRRDVLRGGVALAGGLLIGIDFGMARADELAPSGARINAFIHIAQDDRITFTMPAVEMGQGVYTSQDDGTCDIWVGTQVPGFAQSAAAQLLGIDVAKVTVNNHLIGGGLIP
jgi:xanthine dehydrogenase molybdopterin-binding subunit B